MEKEQNPNTKGKNAKKQEGSPNLSTNQNSKYVIVAIAIIGVILLGGLLALSVGFGKTKTEIIPTKNETPKPIQNITNTTQTTPELNQSPICDDQCNLDKANLENFGAICPMINDRTTKDQCYQKFANQSFDACKMIGNMQNKESCISTYAYREQNSEKCSELADLQSRNRCIEKATSCKGNSTCIAVAKNDLSLCENEDSCLFEFAYKTQNSTICSQISTVQMKAACTYSTTRSDACTQLQYSIQRDLCYSLYGEKTADISACQAIEGEKYLGACYGAVAVERKDAATCTNSGIGLEELWGCYTKVALQTKNATICANINILASNARFECAFESAKQAGDPSACQIITDLGPRIPCYQAILIHDTSKLDPSKCDAVTHPTYKNKCYTEAAKKTGEISYCDKIDGAEERISCIDSYQRSRVN